MNDKPGKPEGKAPANTEREREERPSRTDDDAGKEKKRKPGDAARKMREMFKG